MAFPKLEKLKKQVDPDEEELVDEDYLDDAEEEDEENSENESDVAKLEVLTQLVKAVKDLATSQPNITVQTNNNELIKVLDKKKAWKFTVQRNQMGFITSVEAREI